MRADAAQPPLLSIRTEGASAPAPAREAEFERLLALAGAQRTRGTGEQEARDTAEQLVALVLVEPILARVRESNQAAAPFAPTSGEKQFRSMLDARLARELTRAARFPLVDRLARDLRSHHRTEAQSTIPLRA